uniref:Carbamoyl-phosphate synthase (glutamine-hydrolyzing) n=1 Tax=Parastrongyloides trichosuri TaxID=131310 RepID=A0A0N5A5N7_PARTI
RRAGGRACRPRLRPGHRRRPRRARRGPAGAPDLRQLRRGPRQRLRPGHRQAGGVLGRRPLQPRLLLRPLRLRQDPPAERHRLGGATPAPGRQGGLSDRRTLPVDLRARHARPLDRGLQGKPALGRHAAAGRRPVRRRQDEHPGRAAEHADGPDRGRQTHRPVGRPRAGGPDRRRAAPAQPPGRRPDLPGRGGGPRPEGRRRSIASERFGQAGRRHRRGSFRGAGASGRPHPRFDARTGRRREHPGRRGRKPSVGPDRRRGPDPAGRRPAHGARAPHHRGRDPEDGGRALQPETGRPAERAPHPRHRPPAPGRHVSVQAAHHALLPRHRSPLWRARPYHRPARRPQDRRADAQGRPDRPRRRGPDPQTARVGRSPTARPGEGRDPDCKARHLPHGSDAPFTAKHDIRIWIPAFAGMSGFRGVSPVEIGGKRLCPLPLSLNALVFLPIFTATLLRQGRDRARPYAADHRTFRASSGPGARPERGRASQHHSDPVQRAAERRARPPVVRRHRPGHGDGRRGRGPGERRGPDHGPGPHPLRDRPQAARGRRGVGRALHPAQGRPGAPDRQDALRRLDRRDALLSERSVSAHRGRRRHSAAARRGHRRSPPGPGRNPGAGRRGGRPRRHRAAQDGGSGPPPAGRRRRSRRGPGLGPEDPFRVRRGQPDFQGHRRRLPRLSARHSQRQRQTGRHRQQPVRQGRGPRGHHLGREEPLGEAGLRQRPGEADRPQHGGRSGRGRSRDRLFRRAVRNRLQRPLPAGRRWPDHRRDRPLQVRRSRQPDAGPRPGRRGRPVRADAAAG